MPSLKYLDEQDADENDEEDDDSDGEQNGALSDEEEDDGNHYYLMYHKLKFLDKLIAPNAYFWYSYE